MDPKPETCYPKPDTRRPAGDFDYDRFGGGYSQVRRPDPRIGRRIHEAIGAARSVLNVGAGAGSYEPGDRFVVAVEPSAAMRAQRPSHLSPAINAVAESLPFTDRSFDASMALATVHQWRDLARGLREMQRVTIGTVIVMAFDPDALERFWLAQYAPELIAVERRRYPPIERIASLLGGEIVVKPLPIPIDCTDGFTEAFYARPRAFLDQQVRRAQSAWSFLPEADVERILGRLRADLGSGEWDRRYGRLRETPEIEASLRLIASTPPP